MSTTELVTLTATAFLGALAKELFALLIRHSPAAVRALGRAIKPAITAFLRRYWRILFDVAGLAGAIWTFAWIHRTMPTLDHGTVYLISLTAAWQIYWIAEIGRDLRRANKSPNQAMQRTAGRSAF